MLLKTNNYLRVLWTVICLCAITMAYGQLRGMKMTVSGYIHDSKTGEPLYAATVKVTSADGGTGTFGITDTLGRFEFEVNRPGKYSLDFSFMGYKDLHKEVNIFPGRGTNLGKFELEEDAVLLQEVGTVARSQRMKQVGDTIVYNADAYKVQDGASAEDLVAKMPGIEVDESGVKAQGETVEKILVDGKEFFENDPKLALKTLPAEVVQSVAVFDKKSDQAEFTGFDDGNTVKAMDLITKSYRRNGAFGKVYGSIGTNIDWNDTYYNAGFNLNVFNGNRRISLLGMSNNVNQQNFTFDDLQSTGGMGGRGGGMGARIGSQRGVSRANAFGLNYNDALLDDKLEIQGNYFFNNTRTVLNDSTADDYINTERASISTEDRLSHNYSHRASFRILYRPDSLNEIMFRPSFNYQKSDNQGISTSNTWQHALDSVLMWSEQMRLDSLQNGTRNQSYSESNSWNARAFLLWRHKFDKAGRTLSAALEGSLSGSQSTTNTERAYSYKLHPDFQGSNSDQQNFSYGGNIQWTEPIGSNQQLSLRYAINYQESENERLIGYYDNTFEKLDSVDAQNSNLYTSKYLTNSGELAWRLHTETINLMAGVNLQAAELDGEQQYNHWDAGSMGDDPSYKTSKSFFSVLPNVRFEWNPSMGTQIHLNYRARSSAPSINNLQQSVNTANELAYSTGNPDLDQSVTHNVHLRFIRSNMELATNIMFFAGYTTQQDYIATEYMTNNTNQTIALTQVKGYEDKRYEGLNLLSGARISRPNNMEGYREAYAGVGYGFPWDLLYSNINVAMDTRYNVRPSQQSYISGVQSNGDLTYEIFNSKVRQLSFTPRVHITSNISQDLDFNIHYRPSFEMVKDTENDANDYDYLTHRLSTSLNWTFWKGFTTEQEVNYTCYTGSSMPHSEDEWVWNASIGKKFLKGNKAEIKLQAYDILNTRSGYNRSVSDSYIRVAHTNFMPRYIMLTFSYKIANYKGSSEMRERGPRGRGFGGPR